MSWKKAFGGAPAGPQSPSLGKQFPGRPMSAMPRGVVASDAGPVFWPVLRLLSCSAGILKRLGICGIQASGMSEGFVGTQQPVIIAFLAGISSRLNAGRAFSHLKQ